MNKKKMILIAASVLMLSAVAVKPAIAFLTDTHGTAGTSTVHINDHDIEIIPVERIDENIKVIKIKNTGELPVKVRVKLVVGSTHKDELEFGESQKAQSVGWTYDSGDGYYYYKDTIDVGKESGELHVKITPKPGTTGRFNIIVTSEAARVKADGTGAWEEVLTYEN